MRIGIDLGGTKIELRALSNEGVEALRLRVTTPSGDYAGTLKAISELMQAAEQQLTLAAPASIGLCIPGALSPDTGLVKNANSTCLIGRPLDQDLTTLLQRPVRLANDADCLTLSEATDGAAAGFRQVFGVILGTGVGGGICINGELLAGPNAIAGEWGHNPLPWATEADSPAPPCYCGKRGCIETYLSGPGLCLQYNQSGLEQLQDVETLMQRYREGELTAQRVFHAYCDRLARSLASVINILDPDVVVLGGGLSNIDELYPQVLKRWQDYIFSDQVNTQLKQARHGDASGVRGAAWLWPLTSSE